ADRNRSHWSTSKTPSYTKSVSWQHHQLPAITTLPSRFYIKVLGHDEIIASDQRKNKPEPF
ncbi:hypothetical protein, partial [Klebsiella pneumoniae]